MNLTDSEVLAWLERNADGITILRDKGKGTAVNLEYCSESAGCPCAQLGNSLRDAVEKVWWREKELREEIKR